MGTPDKPERDELSAEVSGAVNNAHVTDTFNIGKGIMRVVNTRPYPKGEHPLEMMTRDTAPIQPKLQALLIDFCGMSPIGIPSDRMGKDLGTAVPKDMITDKTEEEVFPLSTSDCEFIRKKRITQPLGTGDYQIMGEAEQLVHELAKEVVLGAKMSIHSIDTEKIEVEEEEPINVEEEITQYFDKRINEALLSITPDERLRTFFTFQALKYEICGQVIEISPENQIKYVISIKNAINYIVDSVTVRGINKSITLELPNV